MKSNNEKKAYLAKMQSALDDARKIQDLINEAEDNTNEIVNNITQGLKKKVAKEPTNNMFSVRLFYGIDRNTNFGVVDRINSSLCFEASNGKAFIVQNLINNLHSKGLKCSTRYNRKMNRYLMDVTLVLKQMNKQVQKAVLVRQKK